jgi:hypothetical protein
VARQVQHDLTITCGRGGHPPTDPHSQGSAYDVRTKDVPASLKADLPHLILNELMEANDQGIMGVSIGFATKLFYVQQEDLNGPNEHLHVQLRNGRVYPPSIRTESNVSV